MAVNSNTARKSSMVAEDAACKAAIGAKTLAGTTSSPWTTAYGLSVVVILTFFVADSFFLGSTGDTYASALRPLWESFRFGEFFALDFFLSLAFLGLILIQLAGYGPWKKTFAPPRASGNTAPPRRTKTIAAESTREDRLPNGASAGSNARRSSAVQSANAAWNQAIDTAARQGDSTKAGQLLIELEREATSNGGPKPDVVSYNLVIRACAKQGDLKGAELWLARMVASSVEATVCSYNTVLDACAKADNAEACEKWLQKMLDRGVQANVISYATVIYARARRGEEKVAESWLKTMISSGIEPDLVCYNSMIHACSANGNAAGAEHWIEEMQARGLEASVTTFTAVIDACAKALDVGRAEKWLEAMIAAKVQPNVVTFSAMIDACAKACDPVRAEYFHKRMVECGIRPNAHSFSAVINACAKAGDVALAESWLSRSEEAGVATDVVVYSSVIDACGKAGDAERAMEIFRRMQANGIKPHIVAYAALARPYAYRGDYYKVEHIEQEMVASGIAANEYFVYAQLLSYATAKPRQAARAETCFRNALWSGLKVNDHVVSALARAVGRQHCTCLMQELCGGRAVPIPPPRRH